jgi:hypothetical protein
VAAPLAPTAPAFQVAAEKLVELARFIDNEHKCCPFMAFSLEIPPDSGPIWLRMTGPEGTRAPYRRQS